MKKYPIIKGVLFDLDGTLVDTAPDLINALHHALNLHQLPSSAEPEKLKHAASHGTLAMLKIALPHANDKLLHNIQLTFLNCYQKINGQHATLFNNILTLLTALNQKHIPVGIVTNKPAKFTRPLIEALHISHFFSSIISGDSTKHAKPNSSPMLLAAQQINIPCEHIAYFGDAQRDMEAAQHTNMLPVLAHWGYISEQDNIKTWPYQLDLLDPALFLKYLPI